MRVGNRCEVCQRAARAVLGHFLHARCLAGLCAHAGPLGHWRSARDQGWRNPGCDDAKPGETLRKSGSVGTHRKRGPSVRWVHRSGIPCGRSDARRDGPQVWSTADLILKVKEPLPVEYDLMREEQALFTYPYLHLAPVQDGNIYTKIAKNPKQRSTVSRRFSRCASASLREPIRIS
jgi:hypothetical protein